MSDLNTMMRDQARNGLQAALDLAVTSGDTAAATKIAKDIEQLALSTAPKAPPYGDAEIRAQLDKQTWFGTDPKRSAKAVEFGKTMDPKKFATAELFAAAVVKAVDEEFKAPAAASAPENETEEEREEREEAERVAAEAATAAGEKKPRRTDGPSEAEALGRGTARRTSGPWKKVSDAPPDVQKEINRTADKFAPKTEEGRKGYVAKALEAHYANHLRTAAGKK